MTSLVNLKDPSNTSIAGALFIMPEQEVILNLFDFVELRFEGLNFIIVARSINFLRHREAT